MSAAKINAAEINAAEVSGAEVSAVSAREDEVVYEDWWIRQYAASHDPTTCQVITITSLLGRELRLPSV